ncbi:MAG: hypothetical protein ABEL76_15105, partial [Bradymonadaceae bacterium]
MHDQSKQLLGAVRSALAAAVVVVVLPAIDMPAGYMGARDELTRFGALYIGFLAVVTAAIVVGRLRAADHARDAALALHAVNAGVFTPALASDPILAMSVVGWQLVALGFELWRPSHPRRRGGRGAVPSASFDEREEAWFATWGAPARHALSGAVLLIVVVVGYEVTERLLALSTCGIVGVLALSSTIPFIGERLRAERWTAAL